MRHALHVLARDSVSPTALLVILAAGFLPGSAVADTPTPADCPLPSYLESRLISLSFGTELYDGPLLHPAVTSLDDVTDQISDIFLPVSLYPNAYDELVTLDHSYESLGDLGNTFNVFSVTYELGEGQMAAYAYFREAQNKSSTNAALIIPGSGINQSSAIYINDSENYHYNIAALVGRHWDTYVYVKPNEDLLAIHDGNAKLHQEYIIRPHLNSGGSYSCRYLVDSMAIVKHLKTLYDKTVVIGLSQGGEAALYNSLQSHPDGAIVSSGFSVMWDKFLDGGLGQIIIPGMKDYHSNDAIHEGIQGSETEYLFTWGLQETGIYRAEAVLGCTANFFSELPNVTCVVHGGRHRFPRLEVTDFLWSIGNQVPDIAVAPSSLEFGESYVGVASAGELVVRNLGTGLLSVSDVFCGDAEFSTDVQTFDLAPGDSMVVAVELTPVAQGDKSEHLTISSNDPDEPEVLVELLASAVEPPRIAIAPDSVGVLFHPIVPRQRVLTVGNSGGSELRFSVGVDSQGSDRIAAGVSTTSWLSLHPTEGTIAPGESTQVTLSFDGVDMEDGAYSEALVFTSNDPYMPSLVLPLTMLVKRVDLAALDITPTMLNPESPGKWVKARMELTDEYDISEVDPGSVMLQYAVYAADISGAKEGDGNRGGSHDLFSMFDRTAVTDVLPKGEHVPVVIAGEIPGKAWFFGVDSITVADSPEASTSLSSRHEVIHSPTGFALYQSVPNPTAGRATLTFDIPRSCHVKLSLFDAAGRLIGTLADEVMYPGRHSLSLDVRDDLRGGIKPGVYIYEIVAGEFRAAKKLLVSY